MARIAGVDLPRDKRIEIGLTYVFGIGRTSAKRILEETGILCTADQLQLIGTTVRQSYIGDDFALRRDLPAERVRLQPGETCDAMWVSEEKLDQMIASGELAPSVAASLAPIRQRFSELLQGSGET